MELALIEKEIKMTSREIAGLTNKRHSNVYRDIDKLCTSYVKLGMLTIERTSYKHPQNSQEYYEFNLNKMQCFDLLTGYSTELRIKVNRRWEELEKKNGIPQTFAESLRLLADQVEKNEKQALQLEEQKPKVSFANAIEGSESSLSMGAFAKTIGYGPYKLFEKLRDNGILMTGSRHNQPKQKYLNQGYFEVTESVIKRTNGDQIVTTTLVTGKGQLWISKRLGGWDK